MVKGRQVQQKEQDVVQAVQLVVAEQQQTLQELGHNITEHRN
jgi:hypothetical protein